MGLGLGCSSYQVVYNSEPIAIRGRTPVSPATMVRGDSAFVTESPDGFSIDPTKGSIDLMLRGARSNPFPGLLGCSSYLVNRLP